MRKGSELPVLSLAAILLLSFSTHAAARDREFHAVMRHIESTYHARPNMRFLMWSIGMVVRVAHPEGVSRLRMAIFEHRNFSGIGDDRRFASVVEAALAEPRRRERPGPGWRLMVRSWSRRDNEQDYIYARARGKRLGLFIVSLEPDEAVVMELEANARALGKYLDDSR